MRTTRTPPPPAGCCDPPAAEAADTTCRQWFARHPAEVDAVARRSGTGSGTGCRGNAFCFPPLLGSLLFENNNSEARDHCANERTFLSWIKMCVYLDIVSVAIVLSFHLKQQPTKLELRMAIPLGAIFWVLSLACLGVGLANYMNTINKYGRKTAIVQSGWKTQMTVGTIAICIVGASVTLIIANKIDQSGSFLSK